MTIIVNVVTTMKLRDDPNSERNGSGAGPRRNAVGINTIRPILPLRSIRTNLVGVESLGVEENDVKRIEEVVVAPLSRRIVTDDDVMGIVSVNVEGNVGKDEAVAIDPIVREMIQSVTLREGRGQKLVKVIVL